MPTKQETFDTVVAHARKQKCQAYDKGKGVWCCYRTEDGKKCFAGCLIPDELYDPEMEGGAVGVSLGDGNYRTGLVVSTSSQTKLVSDTIESLGYDCGFVYELQKAHDQWLPADWEDQFARLAAKHGLTYVPPDSTPVPV